MTNVFEQVIKDIAKNKDPLKALKRNLVKLENKEIDPILLRKYIAVNNDKEYVNNSISLHVKKLHGSMNKIDDDNNQQQEHLWYYQARKGVTLDVDSIDYDRYKEETVNLVNSILEICGIQSSRIKRTV